ncbi:MAG: glyoxylate carboligase [Burkholderiaceae bacterium]|nr:glyoxylate carboligase [Burkholderiaceae bacterium]
MALMKAAMAAVLVMEKEGVTTAFGVPGAAINPLYAQLRERQSITHILARHVEGASHMAEGYTRAKAGNIGVCIGTSGPAGTDMITGLYSATADSIPILCITGQAPRARLYKEDFQAVDIESIAKPVTKMSVTVREPGLVPRVFQQAFHVMRSGRPGPVLIDLPIDVQLAEIEFDIDTYEPLPVYKPFANKKQIEKAMEMLMAADKPLIVSGGGVINADAADLLVEFAELTNIPVIPTLMGWGTIPDDHPLMAGMVGLQTSHRYGNATMLASDFVLGIGNRWANRHTGSLEVYTKGRKFVHVDVEPTQIGRVFNPDYGIVSDAKAALELFVEVAMNEVFKRDTIYVSTIGLSQIAGGQFLHVYGARQWINCGQAGPLGWTVPAALGVLAADPTRTVVGLSGDYDFQFLIEELAVGAQFHLPLVMVLVNNSYLGLIRQAQRGFDMDYCVQLAFDNINVQDENLKGYGVDHAKVVEGLGCKSLRVTNPAKIQEALIEAQKMAKEFRVPVVVEIILEKVTNIAMGTEINNINEFEDIDCRHPAGTEGLVTAGLLE